MRTSGWLCDQRASLSALHTLTENYLAPSEWGDKGVLVYEDL